MLNKFKNVISDEKHLSVCLVFSLGGITTLSPTSRPENSIKFSASYVQRMLSPQKTGRHAHQSTPEDQGRHLLIKPRVGYTDSDPLEGTYTGPPWMRVDGWSLEVKSFLVERDAGQGVTCLTWKGIRRGARVSVLFGFCSRASDYRSGITFNAMVGKGCTWAGSKSHRSEKRRWQKGRANSCDDSFKKEEKTARAGVLR